MSERKYKVGDVVKTLVDTDMHGNKLFPEGTIGTITVIQEFERLPYMVETDENEWYYYSADMIEPVDENGTPKHEMTREEIIERLKSIKSLVDKYDDVVALREAIKALEQEPKMNVLDKISTEIEQYEADCIFADTSKECKECDRVMFGTIYRIIDKYKKESEEQA